MSNTKHFNPKTGALHSSVAANSDDFLAPPKFTGSPAEFIQKVLKACKLGFMSKKTRAGLEEAIERRLAERITATIVSNFGDKELAILDEIVLTQPDLDHLKAIMTASSNIPNLESKIMKAMQNLYDELTYDAVRIKSAL